MDNKIINLSGSGKVAVMIGLALCVSSLSAQPIEPSNGNTTLQKNNGTPVINIATPNSQGLSHNQYNRYDVDKAGVVLNNSLHDGNAQLAKGIKANPNLVNHQVAKVILNEVVSKNPSLLAGKQEVFGIVADYVLANPNGINCDGCGFINTNRASLVVGKPLINQSGSLSGFDLDQGELSVKGAVNGAKTLDLLAPRANVDANVQAQKAINIVAGRGSVDYPDLTAHAPTTSQAQDQVLDGSLLGSMSAGHIHIHQLGDNKTDVQASLNAKKSIDIYSSGTVNVQAGSLHAPTIDAQARNLNITGKVVEKDTHQAHQDTDYRGVTQSVVDDRHEESFQNSRIQGQNVHLKAEDDIVLQGVKVKVGNLDISANNVDLQPAVTTTLNTHDSRDSKFLWYHDTNTQTTHQQVYQNQLNAHNQVNIQAKQKINASALNVQAKSLNLQAGSDVHVDGINTVNGQTVTEQYKNETASLKSGNHSTVDLKQSNQASQLKAQNVHISGQNVLLNNTQVSGQNIHVRADNQVNVGSDESEHLQADNHNATYWGGIGGGENHIDTQKEVTQNTTTLHTGKNSLNAPNIEIQAGSQVVVDGATLSDGGESALLVKDGQVNLGGVYNQSVSHHEDVQHGAFYIPTKTQSTHDSQQDFQGASAQSDKVTIQAGTVSLTGVKLQAKRDINVIANHVKTDVASSQTSHQEENYHTSGSVDEHLTLNLDEQNAGLGLHAYGVTHRTGETKGVGVANQLKAQNVNIKAHDDVHLKGSQIQATAGSVNIDSHNVTLDAGHVVHDSSYDDTIKNGIDTMTTVEKDSASVTATIGTDQDHHQESHDSALTSQIKATGDVNVHADNQLNNYGTQINAQKAVHLSANQVNNNVAQDHDDTHDVTATAGVVLEGHKAYTSVAGGGSIGLQGEGKGTRTHNTNAVVSHISGSQVEVNATNDVNDTGTQYQAKTLNIQSASYNAQQANNQTDTVEQNANANLTLGAGTESGQEVTINVGGSTGYQYKHDEGSKAVLGQVNAQQAHIQASHIRSNMNVQAKKLVLNADNIALTQGNNTQQSTQGGFELGGSVDASYVPASNAGSVSGVAVNAGVNALKQTDSQAVNANIQADNLAVNAQQDVRIEGSNIQSKVLNVKASNVNYASAKDYHHASGGNGKVNVKVTPFEEGNGEVGAGFNIGVTSEDSTTIHGGKVVAEQATVNSTANNSWHNATIQAKQLNVHSANGNVAFVSDVGRVHKDDVDVGANVDIALADNKPDNGSADFHVNVDHDNSSYQPAGQIQAKKVNLSAHNGVTLQTALTADKLQVKAGGDVNVQAVQDHVDQTQVNISANAGGKPVAFDENTELKDVGDALKDDYDNGTFMGMQAGASLDVVRKHNHETHSGSLNTNKLDITTGSGRINLQSSDINTSGITHLHGANIHLETPNVDSKHEVEFHGSANTPDSKKILDGVINNDLESPVSLSYTHSDEAEHSVNSNVKLGKKAD